MYDKLMMQTVTYVFSLNKSLSSVYYICASLAKYPELIFAFETAQDTFTLTDI